MEKPLRKSEKYTVDSFIKIHGNKYLYDKYEYFGAEKKSIITCKIHGDFEQIPYTHLRGVGCPTCGVSKVSSAKRLNTEEFFRECYKRHNGFYSYDNSTYSGAKNPIIITCPVHGDFSQEAYSHKSGKGCPKCGLPKGAIARRGNLTSFISKAVAKHGNIFDYSNVVYVNSQIKVKIRCSFGHEFEQTPANHLSGYGCSFCQISPLHAFLHSNLGGEMNNRTLLGGNKEIDLYFEDEGVGIEVNGVYFHSDRFVKKQYHQTKVDLAKDKGIKLFHVWQDKNTDPDLILSWIKSKLGRTDKRVYARQCEIRAVPIQEYKGFMGKHHLQGYVSAKIMLGLYYKGSLTSAMGISNVKGDWILNRFASERHHLVVGGFSKLLSHFIKEYQPESIITFSDMSYSDGNVYLKTGFKEISVSQQPRLYYTDGITLENRMRFQRKNIQRRRPDIPWSTEKEMAKAEGFYQLWGCKTIKWQLDLSKPSGV
jgi:hypothetical protein